MTPPPAGPDGPAGDTRERPAVVVPDASQGSRYPLYADDTRERAAAPPPAPVVSPAPAAAPPGPSTSHRAKASPLPYVLIALAMVAAALLGLWLATRGDSDEPAPRSAATSGPPASAAPTTSPEPEPSSAHSPGDLAPHSQVKAPPPVPPSRDLANRPVRYPASNMLDDDPSSAYRTPGDATGKVITFTLPQAVTLTEVGMVNGYAKRDSASGSPVDWYPLNRRVLRVEWIFDDGTTVTQRLDGATRLLQSVEVGRVQTRTVRLRILAVSEPGAGPRAKNATAISDILLRGADA